MRIKVINKNEIEKEPLELLRLNAIVKKPKYILISPDILMAVKRHLGGSFHITQSKFNYLMIIL